MNTQPTAIVLIGHGSSHPQGVSQFLELSASLQAHHPSRKFYPCFMELAEPSIDSAIEQALADGHSHILCQPALLLAAGHAKNDLPVLLRSIAASHPDAKIRYGMPVQITAELVSLCAQQITAATSPIDRSQATLLVVGRGTTDPDANSHVARLARILEETLGFAESSVCFFSSTSPRLPEGLLRTAKRTSNPVVLFPFILFSGVLNDTLNRELALARSLFPSLTFICSSPIGSLHPFTHILLSRILSSIQDEIDMPCLLCKYRSPLPGLENSVGIPQTSHLHDHDHDHNHSDHDHDHTNHKHTEHAEDNHPHHHPKHDHGSCNHHSH